jgi:hypothetical protein
MTNKQRLEALASVENVTDAMLNLAPTLTEQQIEPFKVLILAVDSVRKAIIK